MAANDSNQREFSKKNERLLIIDYIRLPSLNSLVYSELLWRSAGCMRSMNRRRNEGARRTRLEKKNK